MSIELIGVNCIMTSISIIDILDELLKGKKENEVVEFKTAKDNYDFADLGKYFSALSNEANLKGKQCAWLIFGIDKNFNIVGTKYRNSSPKLESLKQEIAVQMTNNITFMDIFDITADNNERVLLFKIPPAPRGNPIAFQGHWYGRNGESLCALNIEELDRIRTQFPLNDWSSGIVENVDVSCLDTEALILARKNFKIKNPRLKDDVDSWDDLTFLKKAKLTKGRYLTRAALLLLGRNETESLLDSDPKIRWILKGHSGEEKAYEIFGIPLLLAIDQVFLKIRNIKYRYMHSSSTIFPEEIDKYDPFSIREALNNCIAHQDYTLAGRINVIEHEDSLQLTNVGSFLPGNVESVVIEDAPPEIYRNRLLI